MKDSHREPLEFIKLMEMTKGKMSVFCNQWQYMAFQPLGAPGFWSIDSWMGPWPLFALRDAMARGDMAKAKEVSLDLAPPFSGAPPNLSWRETGSKIGVKYAGYVDPGPLRPPFLEIPPEVDEQQKRTAERWKKLCDKYRADARVPA